MEYPAHSVGYHRLKKYYDLKYHAEKNITDYQNRFKINYEHSNSGCNNNWKIVLSRKVYDLQCQNLGYTLFQYECMQYAVSKFDTIQCIKLVIDFIWIFINMFYMSKQIPIENQ